MQGQDQEGTKTSGLLKWVLRAAPVGCVHVHTQKKTTINHLNIIINKLTACKAHPNWVAQEERGKKRSQKQNNRNNPFRC